MLDIDRDLFYFKFNIDIELILLVCAVNTFFRHVLNICINGIVQKILVSIVDALKFFG